MTIIVQLGTDNGPDQQFFLDALTEEVGDLSELVAPLEVARWINEGRTRVAFLDHKTGAITWDAGDLTVDLPTDLVQFSELRGRDTLNLGPYKLWGNKLVLDTEEGAPAAGSATVLYRAYYPEIDYGVPSELPAEGNRALLCYALYRFFKKLCSSRSNYRRYSTLVGQNAVGIEDLQAEADRHYDDFADAAGALPPEPPATFFTGD